MEKFAQKAYGIFAAATDRYHVADHVDAPEQNPYAPGSIEHTLFAKNHIDAVQWHLEDIIRDTVASGAPFEAILLRYFNPVGAHPSALIGELPNGVPQNLIPYLTQAAMGVRPMLSVFGDDYPTPDGTCIRDFINVVDLAKAHVVAVERIVEGKCAEPVEVFNLGTGQGVSVLELINTFESATGVPVPHKFAPRRDGDIIQVWADPTRANEVLGWTAEVPVEETMRNAWAWQCTLPK